MSQQQARMSFRAIEFNSSFIIQYWPLTEQIKIVCILFLIILSFALK